jgi:hypothetical protein
MGRDQATLGDELVDTLARALASSASRRQVLRVALAGVVGTALAGLGVKTGWAQFPSPHPMIPNVYHCGPPSPKYKQSFLQVWSGVCCCGNTAYLDRDFCCVESVTQGTATAELMRRYPSAPPENCPERAPHSSYDPEPGYCSGILQPQQYWAMGWGHPLVDFRQCCPGPNQTCILGADGPLDCCYGVCGVTKNDCDSDFNQCLINSCWPYASNQLLHEQCKHAASLAYMSATKTASAQLAYIRAQSTACDCCPRVPNCTYIDFQSDHSNCGQCGKKCKDAEDCVRGQCVTHCLVSQQACGAECIGCNEICCPTSTGTFTRHAAQVGNITYDCCGTTGVFGSDQICCSSLDGLAKINPAKDANGIKNVCCGDYGGACWETLNCCGPTKAEKDDAKKNGTVATQYHCQPPGDCPA